LTLEVAFAGAVALGLSLVALAPSCGLGAMGRNLVVFIMAVLRYSRLFAFVLVLFFFWFSLQNGWAIQHSKRSSASTQVE
jgi:uncharacterized membrane protein